MKSEIINIPYECNFVGFCLGFFFHFLLAGGNTSVENNPKHDGDDGTSFLSPEAVPFLSVPLKGDVKELSRAQNACGVYRQELTCLYFSVQWKI